MRMNYYELGKTRVRCNYMGRIGGIIGTADVSIKIRIKIVPSAVVGSVLSAKKI